MLDLDFIKQYGRYTLKYFVVYFDQALDKCGFHIMRDSVDDVKEQHTFSFSSVVHIEA